MSIGEKLQMLRRSRGLSQEQLAETLGVSRQAISKWENGESAPDLDKIRAICTYFNVTTDYLIWERPEDMPRQSAEERTSGAEKRTDHAARCESVRAAVRGRGYWAGYIIAIIGGALLMRMVVSLLALYGLTREMMTDEPMTGMLNAPIRLMLPYLICYAAMLFGGLALGWWLKRRKR